MQYEEVRWTASRDGERKTGVITVERPETLEEAIELYGSEERLLQLAFRMDRTDKRNAAAAAAFPRVRTEEERERDRMARAIARALQEGRNVEDILAELTD